MKRQAAIELYLSKNPTARTMLKRIMVWDPKRTLRENAKAMKVNEQNARSFKVLYSLPHAKDYLRKRGQIKSGQIEIVYKTLVKHGNWSVKQVAQCFGVSESSVFYILQK